MTYLLKIPKIYWILLLAFFLRLGIFLYVQIANPDAMWTPDTDSYYKPAVNLFRHGTFSRSDSAPFKPETIRTPGYPMMMAIVYAIFGVRQTVVVVFQVILSVLMVFLIYKLGMILFNQVAGLLAAFLLAIEPTAIYYSNVLLTETLFNFILICFVFSVITILINSERHTIVKVLIASFLLAMATMVKPVSYYLPIPIGIGLLIYLLFNVNLKKAVICVFLFAFIQLGIIGGWQARNYIRTGCWEYTTITAKNILYFRAANVMALKNGISYGEAREQLGYNLSAEDKYPGLSEAEIFRAERNKAISIIKKQPWTYAKLYAKGVLIMFADPGTTSIMIALNLRKPGSGIIARTGLNRYFLDYLRNHKLLVLFNIAGLAYLLLVYTTFAIGALRPSNRLVFIAILLLLGLMLYFVLLATPESYSRIRFPIMPYILLIAGHGLYRCVSRMQSRFRVRIDENKQ